MAAVWESLETELRDRISRQTVKIPPYPAVAMRLQKVIDGGDYGVADLARVAAEDPALAASVLRLANSARFGGGGRVVALRDAIRQVGAREVGRLALASGLGSTTSVVGPLAELRRTAWRQAIASAVCCQTMAPMRAMSAENAFVCGLLHDFGKVVAIACAEDLLPGIAGRGGAWPETDWQRLIDAVHVDCGLLVALRWNLPELVRSVMASHHVPDHAGPHADVIDLVTTSDAIVELLERCPYLLPRDFSGIPGLQGEYEIEQLMLIVPHIPEFINSLDEDERTPRTHAASSVAKPSSLLPGDRRDVDLPVVWKHGSRDLPLRGRYITEYGLGAIGRPVPHEGSVVRFRLGLPDGDLDISGRVVLATPEAASDRVEVRLFAPPNASRARWESLWRPAPAAIG